MLVGLKRSTETHRVANRLPLAGRPADEPRRSRGEQGRARETERGRGLLGQRVRRGLRLLPAVSHAVGHLHPDLLLVAHRAVEEQ